MRVSEIFCYIFLMIAVTETCAQGETYKNISQRKTVRRNKRDTSLLLDDYPSDSYVQRPKIIYRRISRPKYPPRPIYGQPKPKYGPPNARYGPPKLKYGPPKHKYGPPHSKKPIKRYRTKYVASKYGPPRYKKRGIHKKKYTSLKSTYGSPNQMHPNSEPIYGPFKHTYSHQPLEPTGFAEPPTGYSDNYQLPKTYAVSLEDSYRAPSKTDLAEEIPIGQNFAEVYPSDESFTSPGTLNQDYSFGDEYQSWQNFKDHNFDNDVAFSKKRPVFKQPDENFEYIEDSLNANSDVFKYNRNILNGKKHQQFSDSKAIRQLSPSKLNTESRDHILVGGQYAEPPARYMPRFRPSAPMYAEDDFIPSANAEASSATVSPYVNYKYSNMAFSPQNLNDAFSIVN